MSLSIVFSDFFHVFCPVLMCCTSGLTADFHFRRQYVNTRSGLYASGTSEELRVDHCREQNGICVKKIHEQLSKVFLAEQPNESEVLLLCFTELNTIITVFCKAEDINKKSTTKFIALSHCICHFPFPTSL